MQDSPHTSGWSARDYATQSEHHRDFDDWFLDRLTPEPGDMVLDLGCGSGEFTALIASTVPDSHVIGLDKDASMIEQARQHRGPNLRFVQARAERIDEILDHDMFDVVVSRAMLHWLPRDRYGRCFRAVRRVLHGGGWFHSESAGAGNLAAVMDLLQATADRFDLEPMPPFPDAGTTFDLLEGAGFELPREGVRTIAQRRAFDREELVGFLRTQVAVALTRQVPADARAEIAGVLTDGVDDLQHSDGTYDQTFVRLEILARRPAVGPDGP